MDNTFNIYFITIFSLILVKRKEKNTYIKLKYSMSMNWNSFVELNLKNTIKCNSIKLNEKKYLNKNRTRTISLKNNIYFSND